MADLGPSSSADEIEFEEERTAWEVDDARMADGRDYDLKLNPQTLDIVSRKLDDQASPLIRQIDSPPLAVRSVELCDCVETLEGT